MMEIPETVVATIRRRARYGVTYGRDDTPSERTYYRRCTYLHWHTGTLVMFTRDAGHHTSGWMKNPDYERCLHLSLSFREPRPTAPVDQLADPAMVEILGGHVPLRPWDDALARRWVSAILGDGERYSWHEGPFSWQGNAAGVQHWRVFCDHGWKPIKPRGEVYSRELTEAGWRSWSDQQPEPNWVSAE